VVEGDVLAEGTHVWFAARGGYGDGSFAERATVGEPEAIELPPDADEALAASLGIAAQTAWAALEWRAQLEQGETVLVLGASGAVGQVAVQAAKVLGAGRVVAAARDEAALARARELGADAAVALGGAGGPEELAQVFHEAAGGDVQVTIDPLWGEPAVAAAHAAAPQGRIVQLGQSAGVTAELPSSVVRGKGLSILGLFLGLVPQATKADAFRRMLSLAQEGKLVVEHEVLPLDRVGEAWARQAASPHGKLLLRP
jgi:NADPH:quinone reductase-like Zn-dependent oxidoreductase